ncbi:KUP/HAK/KT family potassium transporter, partial [Rhizobium leguminosarum]|uniref:KUP/HAK/KT family potassium transporter n=1 Tax=Rhizobium leguminosarum TaxID=384 RepID=UPI003F98623D
IFFIKRASSESVPPSPSLSALRRKKMGRNVPVLFFAGLIGAALFIGDAMITPAWSVMSALEGLKRCTPAFAEYVLLAAAEIRIVCCAVQA